MSDISYRFRLRRRLAGADEPPADHLAGEMAAAEVGNSFYYGWGDDAGAATQSHLLFRSDGERLWHDIIGAEDGTTEFVGDGSGLTDVPVAWNGVLFEQAVPAMVWTIDHNLGHRPHVTIFDPAGEEIFAPKTNPTLNRTTITFSPAAAGSARLE